MMTIYVCMTIGGTDAESSAKGLLVSIKLPRCEPAVAKARTDGMAALEDPALTHRMQPPDSGLAAKGAADNDDYGLVARLSLDHLSPPLALPNNGVSGHARSHASRPTTGPRLCRTG